MRALLNNCRQIEDRVNRIYRLLAARPEYGAEVRTLFGRLAADEVDHCLQLDQALQVPDLQRLGVSRISLAKVEEALRQAGELLAAVQARTCSEEEALRLAMTLEENFIKVHLDNAVQVTDRQLATLFATLGWSEEEHLALLRDFLRKWRHQHHPGGGAVPPGQRS